MIQMAMIGAGYWGKNLLRDFDSLDDLAVRYVCVRDLARYGELAEKYPHTKFTTDLAEVLADDAVTAVVVASGSPQHFALASQALQAGKHTFVEKPLALSVDEASALVNLADEKACKLMVGHILEYHPAIAALKKMMGRGELGEPLYLYFQRLNLGIVRSGENAWWALAPHDISLACYLFEAEPVAVSATGHAYLQDGIEDVVFADLTFADGRAAHIHVSWLDPLKTRCVTLVGSQKMAIFDDTAAEKLRVFDQAAQVSPGLDGRASVKLHKGETTSIALADDSPLTAECRHFVEAIVHDTTPRSDGVDGLRVVRILQAGSESMACGGRPIHLDS